MKAKREETTEQKLISVGADAEKAKLWAVIYDMQAAGVSQAKVATELGLTKRQAQYASENAAKLLGKPRPMGRPLTGEDTAARAAVDAGLESLQELVRLAGAKASGRPALSRHMLERWYKERPGLFRLILAGALSEKSEKK